MQTQANTKTFKNQSTAMHLWCKLSHSYCVMWKLMTTGKLPNCIEEMKWMCVTGWRSQINNFMQNPWKKSFTAWTHRRHSQVITQKLFCVWGEEKVVCLSVAKWFNLRPRKLAARRWYHGISSQHVDLLAWKAIQQ